MSKKKKKKSGSHPHKNRGRVISMPVKVPLKWEPAIKKFRQQGRIVPEFTFKLMESVTSMEKLLDLAENLSEKQAQKTIAGRILKDMEKQIGLDYALEYLENSDPFFITENRDSFSFEEEMELWHAHRLLCTTQLMDRKTRQEMLHPWRLDAKKAKAEYANRPHIRNIENPRLKEAVIQAEMDLEWIGIPFGEIKEIVISSSTMPYGRAIVLNSPKEKLDRVSKYTEKRVHQKEISVSVNGKRTTSKRAVEEMKQKILEKYRSPYRIEISPLLLKEEVPMDSLYQTVVHEYLHCVIDQMNHGPKWKNDAASCSDIFHVDISRTNDAQELGVDEQLERESKFVLECESCHNRAYRSRISEFVKNPQKYTCKNCGGHFHLIKGREYLSPYDQKRQDQYSNQTVDKQDFKAQEIHNPPESMEDYNRFLSLYKYVLQCTECNTLFGRKVNSAIIQNPENYCCHCGGSLFRVK